MTFFCIDLIAVHLRRLGAMGFLIHFTVVLSLFLLQASQLFAADWSSIVPPDSQQAGRPEIVPTERELSVGEILTLSLPGNRSYSCDVKVDGDSVKVVAQHIHERATLQGVKPGESTIRIYRKFWMDPDVDESYQLVQVVSIVVKSEFSGNSLLEPPQAPETVPLPVRKNGMEWEGHLSRQGDELVTVITDNEQWQALWDKAFGSPAPVVDFGKYGVACVFLGFKADWLYDIHFGEPCLADGLQIIPYDLIEIILELQGPFRASGQYHMKAFDRKKGYGMALQQGSCMDKVVNP
jgi:hypothetical protein